MRHPIVVGIVVATFQAGVAVRKDLFNAGCLVGVLVLIFGASWVPAYVSERRRYPEAVAEGHALAAAVYAFKDKTGAWPSALGDLVPEFLPAVPPNWFYKRWEDDSGPWLSKLAGFHTYLRYYFPPTEHEAFPPGANAGWVRDDEGTNTYLGDE
jgi:hypothetical protein